MGAEQLITNDIVCRRGLNLIVILALAKFRIKLQCFFVLGLLTDGLKFATTGQLAEL